MAKEDMSWDARRSRLDADLAAGKLSKDLHYQESQKIDELERRDNATVATMKKGGIGCLAVAALLIIAFVVVPALSSDDDDQRSDSSGRQISVRNECEDLVQNQLGQVEFRDQDETHAAVGGGATDYTATGRADAPGRSYSYTCEGTIDADLSLTVRLTELS